MTALLGTLIEGAASSAIRGLGSGHAALVLRPNARPAPVIRRADPPLVLDLYLIKIELNFGR